MGQAVTVVDAFTATPFSGNPAAVCVLAAATSDRWMQVVTAEMNLSETAFLVPRDDGDHDLRWFTPTAEVDLCGHATLASAHVLGGERRFHTRSGLLTCGTAPGGMITLDLPASPPAPVPDPPDWAPALGLASDRVVSVWATGGWTLVEVASAADVRAIVPDRAAILGLGGHMVAVAAAGDREGVDSVARMFAPAIGIDEDPVTGAAHCVIGPWLAARTGRTELTGEQASARGGIVGMRVQGDRVVLSGRAVTVMEGTLLADPPRA
ncbi:MAG TPA: PhzF family phenazine biosynthesis protein [Acidimicrobiales bacterium]